MFLILKHKFEYSNFMCIFYMYFQYLRVVVDTLGTSLLLCPGLLGVTNEYWKVRDYRLAIDQPVLPLHM